MPARELIFKPVQAIDYKNLPPQVVKIFEDTWAKSHLIKLSRLGKKVALSLEPISVPPLPPGGETATLAHCGTTGGGGSAELNASWGGTWWWDLLPGE